MSHYTVFVHDEVGIEACDIVEALVESGFAREDIEVHEEAQSLYGWKGRRRTEKAHVIVRRNKVGYQANDIGFEKDSDGRWHERVSEYERDRGRGGRNKWAKEEGAYNDRWGGRVMKRARQAKGARKLRKEVKRSAWSRRKIVSEQYDPETRRLVIEVEVEE